MSSRDWTFRVQDILKAIEKIERYIKNMTFTKFKQNELVLDAVVRNFEIIGEASKSIPSSVIHSYPDIPWKEMKGMRDILIHEYFGVDPKILWHAAKNNLPDLQKQLKMLLRNLKRDS
jgi:uncharacterized protein with HEPN domain